MTAKKTKAPTTIVGVSLKGKTTGKAQSETAYLNSSQTNSARLQTSAAQVKAKTKTVVVEAPAGAIDINNLVDLLAARLGGNQTQSTSSVSGQTLGSLPVVGTSIPHAPRQSDPATSLVSANPIDTEIGIMCSNLDTAHNLISEIEGSMSDYLAHDSASDCKTAEGVPSRGSESPLHRRLIDRNETLEGVILRLRHLKSRIRN